MAGIHVSITAEPIFSVFGMEITNSIFTAWVVILVVSILLLTLVTNLAKIPKGWQAVFELFYNFLYDLTHGILGAKITSKLFPLFLALFLYILFGSFFGLLPSVGTLGVESELHGEEAKVIPLFRAVTADLNATLALTMISFVIINLSGIQAHHGVGFFAKYFNFSNPVNAFVSILELVSDTVVRITSFTFRLFGNIFAGEVILAVMLSLAGFLVLPFLLFETFVAFIQAFVFVMLTIVFTAGAVAHDEH
jgi:F-type H+-transporting ATPase subunit a